MEPRPINYPQALEYDFDAVVHVVPPGASFSPYNPCCAGRDCGTGCTADCPSQQPVPRTTGDLGGFLDTKGGWQQFVPARCPHCDGTGDVHSIDGEWRGTCRPCVDAIAWDAYSRAWADAMSGIVSFCGGYEPVIKYEPPAPLDWSE